MSQRGAPCSQPAPGRPCHRERFSSHRVRADISSAWKPLGVPPVPAVPGAGRRIITAAEPVTNITDYPPLDELHRRSGRLPGARPDRRRAARARGRIGPRHQHGDCRRGFPSAPARGSNRWSIHRIAVRGQGASVVQVNLKAFRAGREAADDESTPPASTPCSPGRAPRWRHGPAGDRGLELLDALGIPAPGTSS